MHINDSCGYAHAVWLWVMVALLGAAPLAWGESAARVSHYERAQFFYEQGIVFEAIKELETHIENVRDDVEAHMFLSQLLADVGHDERAAATLAHVLYLDPDHQEAERLLTRMRNNLGQRVDLENPDAVLQYARISARPGSYERAATFYRRALALVDTTAVHLEFARMLSWAGAYSESAHHYDIVLARNPGALDVMREAGRVLNAQGNFSRAIEVLETYRARRPEDTGALLDLARAFVWAGQGEEGQRVLHEVIRLEPDRLDILLVQGSLAELENRVLDAYRYYQAALARAPDHAEALARLADLDRGNRIAIARLREQVALEPDDMAVHLALAGLLEAEERYGEAIVLLERANRRRPEHEEVFRALRNLRSRDVARVQARLDRFRSVRAQRQQQQVDRLREWLDANPRDVRTRLELAGLLFDAGQYAAAQAELLVVQQDMPMDPLVIEMMNLLMARQREREPQDGVREGRLLQ